MNKKKFIALVVCLTFCPICLLAQDYLDYYSLGINSLDNHDTSAAYEYFLKSVKENENSKSYYHLATLSIVSRDTEKRLKATRYFEQAIKNEPENIQYRFGYAQYLEQLAKMDRAVSNVRKQAFDEYKQIIVIKPDYSPAYYCLGRLKYEDYIDYSSSYQKDTETPTLKYSEITLDKRREFLKKQWEDSFQPMLNYKEYAQEDFVEAENYFNEAIKNDSNYYDAYKLLAYLYEDANQNTKGIELLNKLAKKFHDNSETHLYLALLYYKETKLEETYENFQKAIELMSTTDKEDFTLNSFLQVSIAEIKEKIQHLSKNELQKFIEGYWEAKDPLILTKYNERLLEHYSRVAYANLRFGIELKNMKGLKTDRGEMLIRYGFPLRKIKLRPWVSIKEGTDPNSIQPLFAYHVSTEIWHYQDFVLGFTDPYKNNEYKFNTPEMGGVFNTQFAEDTQLLVEGGLRKSKPEEYFPKFEGPVFDLSNQTYQFASKNKSQTDVYLSYEIDFSDSLTAKDKFTEGYDVGVFMFDSNFNKKLENKKTISVKEEPSNKIVNTLEMTLQPASGSLAFEMMRKKDKGASAYHGKYTVRDFSGNEFKMSDLVAASQIEIGEKAKGGFERKNYCVLPNVTKMFSSAEQIYLYYEVYNLALGEDKLTEFEQQLTIKKVGDDTILNDVLDIVGLGSGGEKITLTSQYKTLERDSQIYFQLDMSDYASGEYEIGITIKDKTTRKETGTKTLLKWVNE